MGRGRRGGGEIYRAGDLGFGSAVRGEGILVDADGFRSAEA